LIMFSGDLGLYGERLAVVLGFVTLALFIAMGLTCRSFVSLAGKLKLAGFTRSKFYQSFFKYHSFFWYGFFVILFLHVITGFMHTEFPKAGDPDAVIHLTILVFAGSVLVGVGLTFSNCRTFANLLKVFKGNELLSGKYGFYYRVHAYFWIILLLALAGHLAASYAHIGFWPTVLK
jgi:hypothetical protein